MRTLLASVLLVSVCLAKPNFYGGQHQDYQGSSQSQNSGLSPWAQAHMDEVRRMADRMRQEFNQKSYGGGGGVSSSYVSRSSSSGLNFPSITGKSQEELDLLAKQMTEQMIADMKSGRLAYSQISKPNWFEQQAALKLESLDQEDGLQQETQNIFDNEPFGFPNRASEVESLNNFDQVSHVTYPPSVAVVGGKRYITRKNCTTMTTSNGQPSPIYSGSLHTSSSSSHQERATNYPGQVVIPVEESQYERDSYLRDTQQRVFVPEFNFTDTSSSSGDFGVGNQILVQTPSRQAKITINRMNRTITTGPGYQYPVVTGCRGTTVIVNGNVVYNHSQPIGTGSVSCSEVSTEVEWKRKERERLFWLLSQGSLTSEEDLQRWQQQNWQKLTNLAQEYKTTVEEIKEFQRNELRYYFTLLSTSNISSGYYEDWQKKEKARWDWLVQQNQINREELARWQQENHDRLNNLAHIYRISIEELQNWQKNELDRLQHIINQQNSEIARLVEWQNDVRNRLSQTMLEHNVTVEQLKETIRQDLQRLQDISRIYHVDVEEFRKWLETEQQKILSLTVSKEANMHKLTDWQQEERQRLETLIRQFNLSMDELSERLEMERNYIRDFAHEHHINIEKIKEWQRQELQRLQEEGRLRTVQLENWQKQLQDQLKSIIRDHQITITELEEKIKREHQHLESLAQQYQVSIREIENWYKNEAQRLIKVNIENQIEDWQKRERQRIDDIIREQSLTIEELKQRLTHDTNFLNELAGQYHRRVQEIKDWYESELKRLQSIGIVQSRVDELKEWQRKEHERIIALIQNRTFTVEDLRQRLQLDYDRLFDLSRQNRISQQKILEWYEEEIQHCFNRGLVRPAESLTEWQIKESERINQIIQNHTFTSEDLIRRLEFDRQHLETLSNQYHLQIQEIIEWYRKQAESLANRGRIQEIEMLKEWQKTQRDYIYNIIRNQELSVKELENQLIQDQNNLRRIAQDFHISIQELQEWYRKEIQRLVNQGFITKVENITTWQTEETERIMSLIKEQHLNYEALERILTENRMQLYQLAKKYHITIKELEDWYRSELLRLLESNLISKSDSLTQWQIIVRNRLDELVRDYRWSIEELIERFKQNTDNLRDLVRQYNIRIEELEEWYRKELDRLHSEGLIYQKVLSSTLDWKEQERIHLQTLVIQYANSLKRLTEMLLHNQALLLEIAQKYHITVHQLTDWYNKLINEMLLNGQLINDLKVDEGDWKIKETERLHFILRNTRISYDEFIDFLRDDVTYNQMLANGYGINLNILTSFQQEQLQKWVQEGELRKLNLIHLEDWQKRERDNIYFLIKQQSITADKLRAWQNLNRNKIEESALRYRIPVNTLISWQQKELQRIYEIAIHYNTTFNDLELFRSLELSRIENSAHKPTMEYKEYQNWEYNENLRLEELRKRFDFTDESLWGWRRKLFLYCQGLLQLKRECISGAHMGKIDMDRGDQPPNMSGNECEEEGEPEIADPSYVPPPPSLPKIVKPTPIYRAPLAEYPKQTTIYKYEKNRTEHVVVGPVSHREGFENVREYKEESQRPIAGLGWNSASSGLHDSSTSSQGSYIGGGSYTSGSLSHSGASSTYSRGSSIRGSSSYSGGGSSSSNYAAGGSSFTGGNSGSTRRNYASGSSSLGHDLQQQQVPIAPSIENLRKTDQQDFQSDQQQQEDLRQQYEDIGQEVQDLKGELEDLGQQRVQQEQYPFANEDLTQQRSQIKSEYPVQKPIRRTGHGSSSNIHTSNKEYPAKVEEINPQLEVEAVQVTEKPGLWKKIFG